MTDFLSTLSAYDYRLPEELIAQRPAEPRDSSRLLVLQRESGKVEHRRFTDLPGYLDLNDVLVANNTRVLKARLLGHRVLPDGRQGGKVEFVLLDEQAPKVWEGLFHASAKYVAGLRFAIPVPGGEALQGTLVRGSAESPSGTVVAEFDRDPVTSGAGELPLPHYINRGATWGGARGDGSAGSPSGPEAADESAYQTVYAKAPGSAAAPTAGLHFTPRVLDALRAKGCSWEEITLNVGLGTFRPVKHEDVRQHVMHEERYEISPEAAERLNAAKSAGKRLLAVGTTSVRTLESAWQDGRVQAGRGRTALFLRPGAGEFHVVNRLLTNFHLPKSTLLMLVSAFAGRERVLAAYEEAVRERYRFFSYGDAMLIL